MANEVHLFLINDNENTFKFVWAALMEHLKHNPLQAEQCCLITDNVGQCHIKSGDVVEMTKAQEKLTTLGLKVELRQELNEKGKRT